MFISCFTRVYPCVSFAEKDNGLYILKAPPCLKLFLFFPHTCSLDGYCIPGQNNFLQRLIVLYCLLASSLKGSSLVSLILVFFGSWLVSPPCCPWERKKEIFFSFYSSCSKMFWSCVFIIHSLYHSFSKIYYLFTSVALGLYCGGQAFSSCREQGLLFIAVSSFSNCGAGV